MRAVKHFIQKTCIISIGRKILANYQSLCLSEGIKMEREKEKSLIPLLSEGVKMEEEKGLKQDDVAKVLGITPKAYPTF